MNTAEQPAVTVTDAQLEAWARAYYAAQAPARVIAPWPPAHRTATRWQALAARWRCRAALPVSPAGRVAVAVLATGLAWALLALAGIGPA